MVYKTSIFVEAKRIKVFKTMTFFKNRGIVRKLKKNFAAKRSLTNLLGTGGLVVVAGWVSDVGFK